MARSKQCKWKRTLKWAVKRKLKKIISWRFLFTLVDVIKILVWIYEAVKVNENVKMYNLGVVGDFSGAYCVWAIWLVGRAIKLCNKINGIALKQLLITF